MDLIAIGSEEETAAKIKYGMAIDDINMCLSMGKVDNNVVNIHINSAALMNEFDYELYTVIQYLRESTACFLVDEAVIFRITPNTNITVSTTSARGLMKLHFETEVFLLDATE